jgi:hypothetical protein
MGLQLSMFAQTPERAMLTEDYPNFVTSLARMEARPSFVATTWDRLAGPA